MKIAPPDFLAIALGTILVTAVLLMAGCNNTMPNYGETTGPTITFTQTATGSTPVTSITGVDVDDSFNPVTFNALANDPGGVQSISMYFDDQLYPPSDCTTTGGAGYGGGTIPYGPIPAPQSATSSVSGGQVPTELFVVGNVNGPFTCDLSIIGIQSLARPYGATIHAFVSATNYSGITTHATLPITFQGWP